MNDVTGKAAIVTGASKGIGAAIATALAAAGAVAWLTGERTSASGELHQLPTASNRDSPYDRDIRSANRDVRRFRLRSGA